MVNGSVYVVICSGACTCVFYVDKRAKLLWCGVLCVWGGVSVYAIG